MTTDKVTNIWDEMDQCMNMRARASFFMMLPEEKKEEFLQLNVKEQARLLRIANRRRNRWIREYDGRASVESHCLHALGKKRIVAQRKNAQIDQLLKKYDDKQFHYECISHALDKSIGY